MDTTCTTYNPATAFGFVGGYVGVTPAGEGLKNIIIGTALNFGESALGKFIEWIKG